MSRLEKPLAFALFFGMLYPRLHANFLGYGCSTSSGSGCRTCVPAKFRTSHVDCDSCNDGYYLSGKTCAAYNCTIGKGIGCKTCVAQASRTSHADCGSCYMGYKLSGTTCIAYNCTTSTGLGCKTCVTQERRTTNSQCQNCNDGYFLSDITCRAHSCDVSQASGCKTCLPQAQRRSSTDCASCNDGYYLSGTSCEPIPTQGTVFKGFYTCPQGATGLQIHFDEWPAARFRFYPLPFSFHETHNCTGEFNMSASFNGSRFTFKPGPWISNPCNYGTVSLEGILSNFGENLKGNITSSGCSSFKTSIHGLSLQECDDQLGENRTCVHLPHIEL